MTDENPIQRVGEGQAGPSAAELLVDEWLEMEGPGQDVSEFMRAALIGRVEAALRASEAALAEVQDTLNHTTVRMGEEMCAVYQITGERNDARAALATMTKERDTFRARAESWETCARMETIWRKSLESSRAEATKAETLGNALSVAVQAMVDMYGGCSDEDTPEACGDCPACAAEEAVRQWQALAAIRAPRPPEPEKRTTMDTADGGSGSTARRFDSADVAPVEQPGSTPGVSNLPSSPPPPSAPLSTEPVQDSGVDARWVFCSKCDELRIHPCTHGSGVDAKPSEEPNKIRAHFDRCAVPDARYVDDARCTCGVRELLDVPSPEPESHDEEN